MGQAALPLLLLHTRMYNCSYHHSSPGAIMAASNILPLARSCHLHLEVKPRVSTGVGMVPITEVRG